MTVHAKSVFPVHADVTLPTTMIGTCTVSQEFTIDLTGAEPVIRDFKIGQALGDLLVFYLLSFDILGGNSHHVAVFPYILLALLLVVHVERPALLGSVCKRLHQ